MLSVMNQYPTPTRSASTAHASARNRRAHHSDVARFYKFETEEGVPQTEAVLVSCPRTPRTNGLVLPFIF